MLPPVRGAVVAADLDQTTTTTNATATTGTTAQVSATELLPRHLSVWDLLSLGVGGTVGSGIFVLTGQLAAQYAGRAVTISLAASGIAACLSGACYAELAGRMPVAGSVYVYAHVCVGEVAAVVAAACLTLEYAVAGAAVARTWGDKVLRLMVLPNNKDSGTLSSLSDWLQPDQTVNVPACLVSIVCTALLLMGVQESKRVLNLVTALKMLLVLFMIVGGFCLTSGTVLQTTPFAPFGWSGVVRGATSSFFGYLGYDEICCVAGEAKHPARDLPRAILGTLLCVTVCYVLAATALTGMVPYNALSPTAGFPDAFAQRDWPWAAHLTAYGEVVTLPVVVLISLLAQPRLTLTMSVDGLLPACFGRIDVHGNVWHGTFIAGVVMTTIATLVPFTYINDLISAGILVAFSLTNSCLVLLRLESPTTSGASWRLEHLLMLYNVQCFVTAMLWSHNTWAITYWRSVQSVVAVGCLVATLATLVFMARNCRRTKQFGGSVLGESERAAYTMSASSNGSSHNATNGSGAVDDDDDAHYFSTPWVPYLPCLGIAVNWYLIAQLDVSGILLLCLYLGLAILLYYAQRRRNVAHHAHLGGVRGIYQTVQTTDVRTVNDANEFISHRAVPLHPETELRQLPIVS
jgi:amino acid transporter